MTTPHPAPGQKRDSIRFDDDVQEQLAEWCKRERRSKNYAVNYLVRQALFSEFREAQAHREPVTVAYINGPTPPGGQRQDVKICGNCSTGYYGEACPLCTR